MEIREQNKKDIDDFCKQKEMKIGRYILDKNHYPIKEPDLTKWAKWIETADRTVKKTKVGDVDVSTVFLGLDHNFMGGTPLLFETMVFGGKYNEEMERYSTWEEAEIGHEKMVDKVKKG